MFSDRRHRSSAPVTRVFIGSNTSRLLLFLSLTACLVVVACADGPVTPTPAFTTVRFILSESTTRRTDLSAGQTICANNTGLTHIHASWQGFQDAFMEPVGTDRYQITFTNVPVNQRQQVTVSDQNWCVFGGPIGVAASGVTANGATLKQNWWLDATQPGFEFSIDPSGLIISQ